MRCGDCQKFVGLEFPDPELESVDVTPSGCVTAAVRLIRACTNCGQELKEAELELESQAELDDVHDKADPAHLLEATAEIEGTERTEGRARKRSFYGAKVTVTVKCGGCDYKEEVVLEGDVQASDFEEL